MLINLTDDQARQTLAMLEQAIEDSREDSERIAAAPASDGYSAEDIAAAAAFVQTAVDVADTFRRAIAAPQLIGVIEWPSDTGEPPVLIVGAASVEELDRRFIAHLREAIGDPDGEHGDDELASFVFERGWPADDASDRDILVWLTDMRSDLVSTMVMVYEPWRDRIWQDSQNARYLCWCDSQAPVENRPKCVHES